MSTDRLAQAVADVVDRKRFLKKIGALTLGGAAAAMGVASPAQGASCCNLCNSATNCDGCACVWCWCCTAGGFWRCCECYSAGQGCSGGCPAWKSCQRQLSSCFEGPNQISAAA